jgi:type IV pilus assembly protein PilA
MSTTTTHPFAPEEIMAFVDGELSTDRAQSLSAHIDQCAECSTLATDLRNLSRKMTGWQVQPVPERLTGRVAAAAAENRTNANPLLGGAVQRRRPTLRFAVEVASAIAAVLLVLAIATPNLMRSRMAANEASAVGSLRTLNTAAVSYSDTYGHYPPSLKSFGPSPSGIASEDGAGLIDDTLARGGPKSGYLFTYQRTLAEGRNGRGGYTINADPLEPGKSAQRRFSTDQTGTIFANGVELGGPGLPEKSNEHDRGGSGEREPAGHVAETAPMIVRAAELKLVVEKLDEAREGMDRILMQRKGYVGHLSASSESGSTRIVIASLRVPADQLDACIAELKKLGHVTQESQAGEEVTQQHIDLVARLKNSRNTEARLNGVLQQRSGPIKEILDVEKESARVRGEIEQMEAEQQTLEHRVNFASIDLRLAEEYKAQLTTPAPSVAMQLRNAIVDGSRSAFQSLLALVLFLAESGPTLLLWLMILSFPAWLLWRRYHRSLAMGSASGV